MARQTVLVDFVTWPAVGHVVQGVELALGYGRANPGCEIHLLLNDEAPIELATACPWITTVHAMSVSDADSVRSSASLARVPREWDFVVQGRKPGDHIFGAHVDRAVDYFHARIAQGFHPLEGLAFDRRAVRSLRIPIPDASRAFANRSLEQVNGTFIGLKPAGGSGVPDHYPSIGSWRSIIEALRDAYPDISIGLFGMLDEQGGGGDTTSVSREQVDNLLSDYPFCIDCFDLGLFNQLAVAERCAVFVSPHTGFSFAVLAVGTPWLTISGGRYPEFFHPGVPFYSVLPNPRKYPAFDPETFDRRAEDGRILSMCDRRMQEDLPEILRAARILIDGRWSFEKCLAHYRRDLFVTRLILRATKERRRLTRTG